MVSVGSLISHQFRLQLLPLMLDGYFGLQQGFSALTRISEVNGPDP